MNHGCSVERDLIVIENQVDLAAWDESGGSHVDWLDGDRQIHGRCGRGEPAGVHDFDIHDYGILHRACAHCLIAEKIETDGSQRYPALVLRISSPAS